MSGVAAVLWPRGAAPDPDVVPAMLDVMRSRGPDGARSWAGGSVAIGHLAFHTTPESASTPQPYVDPRTGRVIALDGRLDNRDDLHAALGSRIERTAADVCVVAAAYDRWGTDAFAQLVGDFALVLWDPGARQLVCARDAMGVRPLCYARGHDGALLIASEHRALLATGLVDTRVNDARALEMLCDRSCHVTETLFASIHRLAPAHMLVATGTDVRVERYWDLQPERRIRHRTHQEYAAHARALLDQAIRAQTRGLSRVGLYLSGGVDSSSVATMLSAGRIDCHAFSIVFPGLPCDESRFIADVANAARIPSTTVNYEPGTAETYLASVHEYWDLPEDPIGIMTSPLRGRMAAEGLRVALSGTGGDEWFTGSPYHHADWLRRGALGRVAGQCAADVVWRGAKLAARDLLRNGAWMAMPVRSRRAVRRIAGGAAVVPEWISRQAAAAYDLEDRIAIRVTPRRGETFAQADMGILGTSGQQLLGQEIDDRSGSRERVEQRDPFGDRRVVEFAYAIPDEHRWFGKYRKRLLRTAVSELPPSVRWRRDKSEFSYAVADALAVVGGEQTPRLMARGWVDTSVVGRMQSELRRRRAAGDVRIWSLVWPLWMFFALECWLEHVETRSRYVRREHAHSAVS